MDMPKSTWSRSCAPTENLFTVMAQEHSGPFLNGPKGELPVGPSDVEAHH